MNTASSTAAPVGVFTWPRRAESWLDARGRKAWIVAMVLAFVFVWPVGLGLLAYMLYAGKFSSSSFPSQKEHHMFCRHSHRHHRHHDHGAYRPSGNSAFDAYKAETLRRLETEQEAFESFLQRLREAKDKSEFDSFMDDRARAATAPVAADADVAPVEQGRPGSY